MKKYFLLFSICFIFRADGYGQNMVTNFNVVKLGGQIKIDLSASESFRYEIIPFDSKTYVLIKLQPLIFGPSVKESAVMQLKKLPVTIHALELMDQILMLTFKNISRKQLHVIFSELNKKIEIVVSQSLPVSAQKLSANKKSAKDYYLAAAQHVKKGYDDKAISALHNALRLQPRYPEVYYLAGEIRFNKKQWEMAKINFEKAKRMNPDVGDVQNYLALIDAKLHPVRQDEPDTSEADNFVEKTEPDSTAVVSAVPNADTTYAVASVEKPALSAAIAAGDKQADESSAADQPAPTYFQIGFFFAIILFVVLWGVLLWEKRNYFRKTPLKSSPDFSRLLQQLQKSSPQQKNRAPDKEEPDKKENAERKPRQVNLNDERQKFSSLSSPDRATFNGEKLLRRHQPVIPNVRQTGWDDDDETVNTEHHVLNLASIGYSVEEIARQLQLGKGEVRLMLTYRGRHNPMTAPEVRIEMD